MMEQFLKLPPAQKAGVLLAILAVIGAGAYFLLIDPELTRAKQSERDLDSATAEMQGLSQVATPEALEQLRKLKDELVEADKENRKMLPSAAEVPDLIETIQKDALQNNLVVSRFDRLETRHQDLVDAVPVRMTVTGSLLDLLTFLRTYAGPTRRVIHLRGLSIEVVPPQLGELEKEFKASLPPELQRRGENLTDAEKQLQNIEVFSLGRKKSVVRATFTAYAYTWTGSPPPEGTETGPEGKRKRT